MPRIGDIATCPQPPMVRSSGLVAREYEISLVTPLFGGGAEAGTPDDTLPIRGTSIRGQLQFWWRAMHGVRFATHEELFASHAKIWGKTDSASPVEIAVHDVTAKPARPCARYEWNQTRGGWRLVWEAPFASSRLPYALFPFQGKQPASRNGDPEEPPSRFIETASFTLRLRYPQALGEDVETAVRAWVNFGGLGARTRRGCGALLCKELAPRDLDDLTRWFKSALLNGGGHVRDWPTMPSSALVGKQAEAPIDAWKNTIGLLQAFRQGAGIGRNPGTQSKRPGRSRYPEPETIRRVTGQHARLTRVPDDAFPRAEFGLPIVFHFQGNGEPPDTVLYPSDGSEGGARERMASPLILKPLALAHGKAVPLILRLITPNVAGVELRPANDSAAKALSVAPDADLLTIRSIKPRIRAPEFAKDKDSPLVRSASGSAVGAFLDYAKAQGFSEITR